MNFVRLIAFAGFLVGIAQPVNAADVAANISTARIEAIPIQTLTISDEQFLKGDAYGRPTTIAGTLRIAKGAGRLPLMVLVHGSGGLNPNLDVWGRHMRKWAYRPSRWIPLVVAASSARLSISRSLGD
jgi:hypothetical protein